jgi:hypothetical protein
VLVEVEVHALHVGS